MAVKPDNWDEDAPAKIPDDSVAKPDNWLDDGPEYIADPDASMPDDWCVSLEQFYDSSGSLHVEVC